MAQTGTVTEAQVFDPRPCLLGEGALWHPLRQHFLWFDILNRKLLADGNRVWELPLIASAAGWLDHDRLLLSTEDGLAVLNLETNDFAPLRAVEADNPVTRSNDGRADRQGGFWFSTMGKSAEAEAGAIYRYYRGEVRKLFGQITIPNAISFAPDGSRAYFADTTKGIVWRQELDAEGWPEGPRETFLDLNARGLNPDGAVVDAEGGFWCAKWGASAVMRYLPDGSFDRAVSVGGKHSSCPAFGGENYDQMLVTTALEGMETPGPGEGLPYLLSPGCQGLAEPRVIL